MNFKDRLKNAICNNDIDFLDRNREKFSINERFEDEDNDTLLLYSISDNRSSMYKYFLENNADITLTNDEKENVLHAIIYSGDEIRMVEFLDKYNFNLNSCTIDGASPLLLAISLEQLGMARLLIKKGADVNIGDDDGITPLHLAAQFGYLDLVVDLVENGADLRKKTKKGNYPLALAINGDYNEIAKYLFEKFISK